MIHSGLIVHHQRHRPRGRNKNVVIYFLCYLSLACVYHCISAKATVHQFNTKERAQYVLKDIDSQHDFKFETHFDIPISLGYQSRMGNQDINTI
jgi:hypothetical protein